MSARTAGGASALLSFLRYRLSVEYLPCAASVSAHFLAVTIPVSSERRICSPCAPNLSPGRALVRESLVQIERHEMPFLRI